MIQERDKTDGRRCSGDLETVFDTYRQAMKGTNETARGSFTVEEACSVLCFRKVCLCKARELGNCVSQLVGILGRTQTNQLLRHGCSLGESYRNF